MMPKPPLDLTREIDARRIGGYQLGALAICFSIVLIDGFDTQLIGFAAKRISESRGIALADFGGIFSAGLFGAVVGAFALGPMADFHGRRKTLVLAMVIFAGATLVLPQASGFWQFALCRFVAGLGLGGAVPNLIALSSEYVPARHRAWLTGVLYSAYPLGGVVGAVLAAQVMPTIGWEMLFYLGGGLPLVLIVLAIAKLPESIQFLRTRDRGTDAMLAIARRLYPREEIVAVVATGYAKPLSGSPISHLFDRERALATTILWLGFFTSYALVIVMVLWTPALLSDAGVAPGRAAIVSGMTNGGGMIGTLIGGRVVDRFGLFPTLPLALVTAGLSVMAIGHATEFAPLVAFLAGCAGLMLGLTTASLLGMGVAVYPAEIRSTGLGWGIGVARLGQVVAPLVVSAYVSVGAGASSIFLWAGLPAIAIGAAIFALQRSLRDSAADVRVA